MKKSYCLAAMLSLWGALAWSALPGFAQQPGAGQEAEVAIQEPMPDVIWEELFLPAPVFVAADTLNTPEGLDLSIFPPGIAQRFEGLLARKARRGCIRFHSPGEFRDEPPRDWRGLRGAVASSDHVLLVEVTGVRPGIVLDHVRNLVRVRVLEQLRGQVEWNSRFLNIPLGEIQIGDRRFCLTSDVWATQPSLGDRLLLLYDADWNNVRSQVLFGVTAPHVIVFPKDDDKAHLPYFLRLGVKNAQPPAEDFLAEIREYAEVDQ